MVHNNKTIALLILLLAQLAVVPLARAQEYIKEIAQQECGYSIIREYRPDVRIVYNMDPATYLGGEFLMITESGTATQLLTLEEDISISDFEIYNDTVYFCGIGYLGFTRGIVGHFSLLSFPATLVDIIYTTDYEQFFKLEVFRSKYGGQLHLALTGRLRGGGSCLVDVPNPTSGTPCLFYYTLLHDYSYNSVDDVAVTDNYIVATLRNPRGNHEGKLYYFGHPSPGAHFFYGLVNTVDVDRDITSFMHLEACHDDFFVVSYRTTYGEDAWIHVKGYSGTTNAPGDAAIHTRYVNHYPVDVKYSSHGEEVDVLSNELTGTDTNSIVYHIPYGGHITSRRYDNQRICSMDYLQTDPMHFIASGRGQDGQLWVYKYSPTNERPICSIMEEPEYALLDPRSELHEAQISFYTTEQMLSIALRSISEQDVKIRCYYDMKTGDTINLNQ